MLMKKKWASRAICGLLAVGMLLMTGCSRLPSVTLDQLMEEVNAAHQAIGNDGLKQQFILRQDENGNPITFAQQKPYYVDTAELDPYDPDLELTQEQAVEDVTYLFDILYTCYGNYDRMGGRAAFDAAEQAMARTTPARMLMCHKVTQQIDRQPPAIPSTILLSE